MAYLNSRSTCPTCRTCHTLGRVFTFAFNVLLWLKGQVEEFHDKVKCLLVRPSINTSEKCQPHLPRTQPGHRPRLSLRSGTGSGSGSGPVVILEMPQRLRVRVEEKCYDLIYGYLTARITSTRVGQLGHLFWAGQLDDIFAGVAWKYDSTRLLLQGMCSRHTHTHAAKHA